MPGSFTIYYYYFCMGRQWYLIECQYFVTRDENAQFTLLFGIYLKAKSILFPESEV